MVLKKNWPDGIPILVTGYNESPRYKRVEHGLEIIYARRNSKAFCGVSEDWEPRDSTEAVFLPSN